MYYQKTLWLYLKCINEKGKEIAHDNWGLKFKGDLTGKGDWSWK